MRSLLYVLSAMGVIGLAFWAYQENYKTQESQKEVRQLNREIAAANARLGVLRAEWAYLNRPDRLADLASLNFERLELLPMMPEGFGRIDQVLFPAPEPLPAVDGALPMGQPVTVSSDGDVQTAQVSQ